MGTLEDVVIGFVGSEAVGASVVEAVFALVQAGAAWKFLPAELGIEFAWAVEFRVDRGVGLPVDGVPGGERPIKP